MKKHLLLLLATVLVFSSAKAQSIDAKYFNAMKWRMIGPYRGGRTVGAAGVLQQPSTFYIGVNNGGVWKTNDYGRTWFPIFDDQQIGGLAIDQTNENRVFVAALGHPYGPNTQRGVFRTMDGGITWEKVLYKDENTGAVQVTIDPNNPQRVFAVLWAGRLGPWENSAWNGKESGLYKSTDGGKTWKKITSGLPTTKQGLGRIGFCIAQSDSKRMYATVDAGSYGGI